MNRPKQPTDEQIQYLQKMAQEQRDAWAAVLKRMTAAGFDGSSWAYRRAYDLQLAAEAMLNAARDPLPVWPGNVDEKGLSREQQEYLQHVAMVAMRDLRGVGEYFRANGCAVRQLAEQVELACRALDAIRYYAASFDAFGRGNRIAAPPRDPALDNGAGI